MGKFRDSSFEEPESPGGAGRRALAEDNLYVFLLFAKMTIL